MIQNNIPVENKSVDEGNKIAYFISRTLRAAERSMYDRHVYERSYGQNIYDRSMDGKMNAVADKKYQFGVLFRLKSFWIGWHYSNKCKRLCVNLIPCVTFWIAAKDGLPPDLNKM